MALHITIRQMQVFEAVARMQSFTKAAEELHLTQPAVSMQVKQLESMVDTPLLEQIGKKIYLTPAGDVMVRNSKLVLQRIKVIEDELNEIKGTAGTTMQICIASTVNYFATRLLAEFAYQNPEIKFSLEVVNRHQLLERIDNNVPDLVLMGQPPDNSDLNAVAFLDNPLIIIANPRHPLATGETLAVEELTDQPFLLREEGSGTRLAMERHFSSLDFKFKPGNMFSRNEQIKQGVEAGLGLAVVSKHTVDLELQAGRLVELNVANFPIQRQWYIAHRIGKWLSPNARLFWDFVLAHETINSAKA